MHLHDAQWSLSPFILYLVKKRKRYENIDEREDCQQNCYPMLYVIVRQVPREKGFKVV